MVYMGDESFWDDKFGCRSDRPLNPEEAIVENVKYFKNGTVLDIACGDGRNSLFLLEKGFKVKGVDFSTKALLRLEKFAARNNYEVETELIDLSEDDALKNIGVFDDVLVNHFRVSKSIMHDLKNHLSYGGVLFVSGFGHKHKPDLKIRKEDLIQPDDFESLKNDFELLHYEEFEDERGFFVTYIYRKK